MIPPVDPAGEYAALRGEIDAALREVLTSGQFVGGPQLAAFEAEFAAFLETGHAVGVANGTDAIEIALAACGVGAGDVVAVPAFTFAATVEAVVRTGATPLLIDVAEDDFAIDVPLLAQRLRGGATVRAVLPVHLYGHPADMEALLALRDEYGFALIEDAAQAHGARCQIEGERRRVGSIGDAACFSFYPTKNLGAAGDAGAITTGSDTVARTARLIANHGDVSKYEHALADGRNSRLDALQAAILRVKLRRLDEWNQARRRIAAAYGSGLVGARLRLPRERPGAESVFHQYTVRVAERDRVQSIGPVHRVPRGRGRRVRLRHPRRGEPRPPRVLSRSTRSSWS
jgi:dTDP-4-amino-4,6-dideoxygalactose transaminase